MSIGETSVKNSLVGDVHLVKTIPGYSAYEIAVSEGFNGTREEWLESLKGKDGDKGDKGDPGNIEMFGEFDALDHRIVNVADPVEDGDAVNYGSIKSEDISETFIEHIYDGVFIDNKYVCKQGKLVTGKVFCHVDSANFSAGDPLFRVKSDFIPTTPVLINAFCGDVFSFEEIHVEKYTHGMITSSATGPISAGVCMVSAKYDAVQYIVDFIYLCQ